MGYDGDADADKYRKMEHSFNDLKAKSLYATDEERKNQYYIAALAVSSIIARALRYILYDRLNHEHGLEAEKKELEELLSKISRCKDKNVIDQIFVRANEILMILVFEPG